MPYIYVILLVNCGFFEGMATLIAYMQNHATHSKKFPFTINGFYGFAWVPSLPQIKTMQQPNNNSAILLRILKIAVIILLLPIPFFGASDNILKKFSPYFDGNGAGMYILVSIVCGLISCIAVYFVTNKTLPNPLLYAGAVLFLIGVSMTSVWGLGAQPDFSPNMLKHPEREHLRYALLFLNALLFAAAFILVIRYRWNELSKWHKIIVLLFILAFVEMIWEFQHHFFLGSHLQVWINEGKKTEDFMVNYSPEMSVRIGGLCRFFQYTTIAWLALILVQNKRIKKWVLIIIAVFCAAGMVTGASVFVLGFASFEKLKALMLFFIPAGPFAALYWIGLSLLTTKPYKDLKTL